MYTVVTQAGCRLSSWPTYDLAVISAETSVDLLNWDHLFIRDGDGPIVACIYGYLPFSIEEIDSTLVA